MLSLVVSAVLALNLTSFQSELNAAEKAAWKRIQPSVVTLTVSPGHEGVAALIDQSGLFIGHKTVFEGKDFNGDYQGRRYHFQLVATDETTQLVLLKADDWPESQGQALSLPKRTSGPGQRLLAVLPNGPTRAELAQTKIEGILKPSRRLFSLNEIQFEAMPQEVGGALLFTLDGDLLGALGATLESSQAPSQGALANTTAAQQLSQQQQIGSGNGGARFVSKYGPSDQTTAYTISPDVLQRVIDGFKSPSHEVLFPSIGIFCQDYLAGGAIIQKMKPESPARKAGLQVGDVIVRIDDSTIKNQMGFARVMNRKDIGQKVHITVLRGQMQQFFDVVVEKSSHD